MKVHRGGGIVRKHTPLSQEDRERITSFIGGAVLSGLCGMALLVAVSRYYSNRHRQTQPSTRRAKHAALR
ncbi:MAG: hypothetical protein JSU70_01900 [Phycisphaerales bacterium]|nr:MAG: hypothetical protein JSU70_01900 [Phycisphaerales bacterium]